eukprot:CFRG4028T1
MPMFGRKLIGENLLVDKGESWYPGKILIENAKDLSEQLQAKLKMGSTFKDPILGIEKGSLKKYQKGAVLGKGGFGVVFLVTDKKNKNLKFACKDLVKARIKQDRTQKMVYTECCILQKLKGHPNIVTLEEAIEDSNHVYFVLELAPHGDALQAISRKIKDHGSYSEKDAANLLRPMLEAIKYCHDNGVLHRDIKPENFLFAGRTLKLTDFGLSAMFEKDEKLTGVCGTPLFISPEMYANRSYDTKVDIWAMGVTAMVLLVGKYPFQGHNVSSISQAVQKLTPDFSRSPLNLISPDGQDLLRRLLDKDPKTRMDADQALKHKWVVVNGTASELNIQTKIMNGLASIFERNKFELAAMRLLAEASSDTDYQQILQNFHHADVNKDGVIDFSELKAHLENQGVRLGNNHLCALFQTLDRDFSGTLDVTEFAAAVMHFKVRQDESKFLEAFELFDIDGDGYMSLPEFKAALEHCGISAKNDAERIFAEIDVNKDRMVSFEEFSLYWYRKILKLTDMTIERKLSLVSPNASPQAV